MLGATYFGRSYYGAAFWGVGPESAPAEPAGVLPHELLLLMLAAGDEEAAPAGRRLPTLLVAEVRSAPGHLDPLSTYVRDR